MKRELGFTTTGEKLYFIELETPEEKALMLTAVSRLGISSINLADKQATSTPCKRKMNSGLEVAYKQCEQGNTIAISGGDLVIYESPRSLAYSKDNFHIMAIALTIVHNS